MNDRIKNLMNYKKSTFWIVLLSIILIVGLSSVLMLCTNRLSNANQIEQAARRSKTIGEDWDAQVSMTDKLAAILLYNNDKNDHSFSIYKNKNMVFKNYVFIRGGSLSEIERSILTLNYDGTLILLSMNSARVAKIACHDGETYKVNPNNPFVIIVPQSGISIYDENEKLILIK